MNRFLQLLTVLLCFASSGYAQDNGQIFGKVTDVSGASVPGVTVTLSSPARLQPAVAVTTENGTYQFPLLAIGTYSVKFELTGFRTAIRESIRIEVGFSAQINQQLELSTVEETVQVSGASPVVDVKGTTQATHFDLATLESLPTGRGMYIMASQAPGISANQKDVGGVSGVVQQSISANGGDSNQTRWLMDGVDVGPAGNSTAYWMDFDTIQEMALTTSGADASVMTPGVNINMVSKSGGDVLRGSGRYFVEDQKFESTNLTAAQRQQLPLANTSVGNPLKHFQEYGFEVGGPIKKGKAWFWGSYGEQTISVGTDRLFDQTSECAPVGANQTAYAYAKVRDCLHTDDIRLPHVGYKVGVQLFHGNQFSLNNHYDVKKDAYFSLSPSRPVPSSVVLGSPWDELSHGPRFWNGGWPDSWKFDDQYVVSDRWVLELGYGHFVKSNVQDFQSPSLLNVQPEFEVSTAQFDRSTTKTYVFQPNDTVELTSNYFLPGKLSGDHSLKASIKYQRNEDAATSLTGGGAIARFNSAASLPAFSTPLSVIFYRDANNDSYLYQHAAYVQDTFTRKRLTLNLGLRWDRQTDTVGPETSPASPYQGQTTLNGVPFDVLPALSFGGARGGVVWNTFAPRLGIVYDLKGDSRTVVRASYNQYFNQRFAGELANTLSVLSQGNGNQGATQAFVEFPWTDLNHDKVVQINEVNTSTIRSFGGNFNPANPGQPLSPNRIDPQVKAPRTDEITVGFGRELAANFGVNVNYIWRKYSNLTWQQLNGISSANYSSVTFTPTANTCPDGAVCQAVTYYVPDIPVPAEYTYTNIPDYHRRYQGLELTLRKRFSQRWMMNASYVYNDARAFYTSPDSYQDPTNIEQQNGAQYGALNTKWIVRASGSYRIPWHEINIAASEDWRQGYPFLQAINIASRPNQAGSIAVMLDPLGETRLPSLHSLDLKINRAFRFHHLNIDPALDIFNLFNGNTILGYVPNQNASAANRFTAMLQPRLLRFGFKVTF